MCSDLSCVSAIKASILCLSKPSVLSLPTCADWTSPNITNCFGSVYSGLVTVMGVAWSQFPEYITGKVRIAVGRKGF